MEFIYLFASLQTKGTMVIPKSTDENNSEPGVYELDAKERQEILALSEQLAGSGKQCIDSDWLRLVREKSSLLPRKILSVLRKFRNEPGSNGYLLLRNVPVIGDIPLPNTPCIANSVERVATISASAITLIMLSLGEVIAYRPEKGGALVQNVVPVPGSEKTQSNAGSVLLELHTENAYHENFPDFVSLLCLREDVTNDAKFCTSSIRHALPLLSSETIQVLAEPRFCTKSPPSFIHVHNVRPSHAVLLGDIGDPNILVDFAATVALDSRAKLALDELREALMKTMKYHQLRVGDLAIVDNRVAVHGRTSFVPSYDGNDRWLLRVFAHLDNRRSRVNRKNGGPVMN